MAEQWLSVQAAAAALGIEDAAVRRQIAEDQLTVRAGEAGLEVLVPPPSSTPPTPAVPPGGPDRTTVFEAMLASDADDEPDIAGDRTPAAAPPSSSSRFGRYAPLADHEVGTPIDPNEKPFRSPLLASSFNPRAKSPGTESHATASHAASALRDPSQVDELTRYQRLAGASMVLAQQRSDEAREQIAFARAEAHRLRRMNRRLGTGAAAALACGVLLSTWFAADASRAEGALQTHESLMGQAETQVIDARQIAAALRRENAELTEQIAAAQAERDAAKQQIDQLESRNRETETALQAALVALYQHQPEEARAAVQELRGR